MASNGDIFQGNGRKLRLLVAITSFGEKNLGFLRRIIAEYQKMTMEVDIVVLSNIPKDLGPGVKVVVGLPTKDPWSLPFAHKAVFAENADRYDLFIYTEEDIEITEAKIGAFLKATPVLADDEIAGFQLYEIDKSGKVSLPGVHGAFRWKPESVRQRGGHLVAEFTNEHSACYVLTRSQLKRCLASGGFLSDPHDSRFDIACTASTDPYTSCGFRKVLCLSAIDDFLLHHLPDRYAGNLGVTLEMFKDQVRALISIHQGVHPASTLCEVESKLLRCRWSKNLYEEPNEELLKLIPGQARTILSIGCGWGATEARLQARGARVTALPVDSVLGVVVERLGMEVVHGSLEECLAKLQGRRFDCVVMADLLHLSPNPGAVLEQCARFVGDGGTLLISSPHFKSLRVQLKRLLGRSDFRKLGAFEKGGVSVIGSGTLARSLKREGFRTSEVRFFQVAAANGATSKFPRHEVGGPFKSLTATEWIIQAKR